jgi:hypothetical protein
MLLGEFNSGSYQSYMTLFFLFIYLFSEPIGTAATPGLLCQPRVIMKMIVESMMELVYLKLTWNL